jgi:hypothetical protein
MKILILDNDKDKGSLMAENIMLPGVDIDVFDEYDEALNSDEKYDLLLVDICLGEKRNGSDFIRDYCTLRGEVAIEPYSGNPDIMETMGINVNEFDPVIFPAYIRSRIKQIQDNLILERKVFACNGKAGAKVTTETKEYSKTLCDERHLNHERYEAMRFEHIEKEQSYMGDLIKDINTTLKKKFDDDSKIIRGILLGVLGAFGTSLITLLLKFIHI